MPTITSIRTSTNKKGIAVSVGAKGFGLSYTETTTYTFDLKERIKAILKSMRKEREKEGLHNKREKIKLIVDH